MKYSEKNVAFIQTGHAKDSSIDFDFMIVWTMLKITNCKKINW